MNQMPPTHSQSLAIQQQQQLQQHQLQQQQQQQQKQMQQQYQNGLPSNSTSGNWYGMTSGHHGPPQSMGAVSRNFASNVSGLPDSYVMTSASGGGGAGGRNMVPYYEGTTMQKMVQNHLAPEYNRPSMMPGHVTQNGYLANGMIPKGFGQTEMTLDPSVAMPTRAMMSAVGNRPMQVISPNVDYYQDQRMGGGCRPMYSQQFDPCLPGQGPMMESVRTPMGPGMTAGPEITQDAMVCRDARGSLPQQRTMMGYERIMPYPNPQQYMQNKRAQYSVRRKVYDYDPAIQQYGNGCYSSGWPRQPLPQQSMVSPCYPTNMGGVQCHVKEEPDAYLQMAVPLSNQCQPPMWQSNREPLQRNNTFSPPPGNPTPPMTPGSTSMPCNVPEAPDVRPNGLRPFRENELYFTFPVRDGIVKAPFQLEHNAPVSCHIFNLNDQVHESLMARPELDLMLKCFHKEDRMVATNWPTTVSISLNEVPLMIDRGTAATSPHQPMFLKSICKPGQNTLQISVTTCCCSHLFVLQVVHRPSVRSIFQGLTLKRLLPASTTIGKIKRLLSQIPMMPPALASEQQLMSLPLTCPLTMQRIVLPSRGRDCLHIECFDLESYLKLNCHRNQWQCPWCKKMAALDGLEVDQFIWGILDHPSSSCSEAVLLDISANWKPLPRTGAEYGSDALPNLYKKFVLANAMHLPSPGSYSMVKAPMANGLPAPPGSSSLCHPKEMIHHERHQKPAPAEAPNYLGCLSQMTDVFLGPDASPSVAPQTNGLEHVSFPPTPMGSQISQICTPLDGQSLHPRTPSEGHATHPHTPPDGHPFTPLDSQSLYGKTPPENHGAAGINPHTPSAAFDSCGNIKRGTSTTTDGKCLPTTVASCPGSNTEGGKSESGKQDQSGLVSRGGPLEPENPLITEDLTKLDFKSNLSLCDDNQEMISLLPDSFDYDLSDLTCYLGSGTKTAANKSTSKELDDDFLSFLN